MIAFALGLCAFCILLWVEHSNKWFKSFGKDLDGLEEALKTEKSKRILEKKNNKFRERTLNEKIDTLTNEIRQLIDELEVLQTNVCGIETRVRKVEPEFMNIRNSGFYGNLQSVARCTELTQQQDVFRDAFMYGKFEVMKYLMENRFSHNDSVSFELVPKMQFMFDAYRSHFTTTECVNYYLDKMMRPNNPDMEDFSSAISVVINNRNNRLLRMILRHPNFQYVKKLFPRIAETMFYMVCSVKIDSLVRLLISEGYVYSQQDPYYLEILKKYLSKKNDSKDE